jgi:hypothetical protein
MLGSGHRCATKGRARWAQPLTVLLALLLWWPLVPDAATFARAVHAVVSRADVDPGAVGWSEQIPFESSELNEAEDFEGEHPASDPAGSRAPAHALEQGRVPFEFGVYERSCARGSHERLGRQRGPPIA